MATVSPRALSVLAIVVILLALAAAPAPANAQPNVTGQWATLPYLMPSNPIHAAVLRNGQVLIVSGSENNYNNTTFKAAVWNPQSGTFHNQLTPWDLFCNGLTFLPDGRVIITGGNLNVVNPGAGPPWTTIFDPATEKFYQVESMARGRWYPTNAALGDGATMVFGGMDEKEAKNNTVEIYDVGIGWSAPAQANWFTGWYPRMHLLPNGTVFVSGPNADTHFFDPQTWGWTQGPTTKYAQDRQYGSSVLLPLDDKDNFKPSVVIFGGNTSIGTASVERIDLSVSSPTWVNVAPMSVPRVHPNAILLPTGKILVIGGSNQHLDLSTAHLNAETFDPNPSATQVWTPSGNMAYKRIYHHTALLLPDGTVYVGGSNPGREIWEPHIEIYKPPYLFTSSGAPAVRPTIGSAPAVIGYNQSFTIGTSDAASITQVVLMRPGANSHAFDMEQRLLRLTPSTAGGGTLTAVSPPNGNVAPPGYYMLFIVNASGVPSVAQFVQLIADAGNQPPTATITSPASGNVSITAGQSVTFAATASDPDGSVISYEWVFPGGSPGKSTSMSPVTVTFSTPGVYTVSLTVLDNLLANNPSPPTVTVTVSGSAALGASITSPTNGATVSGTVPVNMAATNAQGTPTQFLLKLDDATTLSNQSVSGSTATYSWPTTGLSGTHTLNLTVTDGAGRTASTSITVTVGSGGPPPPPPPGPGPVVWTSLVNATASGNTVTKSGGCDGCGDAGAVSQQTIASGDGYVEFAVSSGASLTAGLSTGNASTDGSEIKFGLKFSGAATYVEVRESGVYKSDFTGVAGAVYRIAVEGTVVKYYQNGVLKYTSATAPTYPLLLDTGLGSAGAAVQSAVISGGGDPTPPTVTITAPASGTTVSGPSVTVSATASDNVGVVGVQFKLDGVNLNSEDTAAPYSTSWDTTTIGDGTHTLTAVARDAAGNTTTSAPITVTVANSGPPPPPPPPPPPGPGAVVWTSLVNATASGNTVTKSGGCDGCADAGAVSQQTIASGDGYVEFTISSGASLTAGLSTGNTTTEGSEIKFGLKYSGSATFVEVRESGVYKWDFTGVAGAVYRIAVEGGVVKYYQNGVLKYTSGTAPTYPLLLDTGLGSLGAAVQSAVISGGGGGGDPTPPTVTITAPAAGANVSGPSVTVTADANDNVGVVGVQFKLDGVTLNAEDTTAPYSTSWNTQAVADGTHTLTAVARDAAGNTTTSVPVTVTVANGGTPPPPPPGPQAVVWTSLVNVTASGNTITKNGGCNGCWDAGAVSQQTIGSGNGSVEFTIPSGTGATVGLSTGNSGTSGNEIKFGLRFIPGSPGFVEVRESGVYKSDWPQVAGATYKVAVEGGVVNYYQNGVLKYASSVAPTYPLLVDATLDAVGNAVQSAMITTP
jgi:hypothetical protein